MWGARSVQEAQLDYLQGGGGVRGVHMPRGGAGRGERSSLHSAALRAHLRFLIGLLKGHLKFQISPLQQGMHEGAVPLPPWPLCIPLSLDVAAPASPIIPNPVSLPPPCCLCLPHCRFLSLSVPSSSPPLLGSVQRHLRLRGGASLGGDPPPPPFRSARVPAGSCSARTQVGHETHRRAYHGMRPDLGIF